MAAHLRERLVGADRQELLSSLMSQPSAPEDPNRTVLPAAILDCLPLEGVVLGAALSLVARPPVPATMQQFLLLLSLRTWRLRQLCTSSLLDVGPARIGFRLLDRPLLDMERLTTRVVSIRRMVDLRVVPEVEGGAA